MAAKPHLQSVNDQPHDAGMRDNPSQHPDPAAPPVGGPPTHGGDDERPGRQVVRARAEKNLPSDRLGFEKQIDALKAIAQLSGPSKRPVTAEAISAELGLKGNTGGLCNRFFVDNGWIESAGRGAYVASDALINFSRHLGMDPDDLAGARRYLTATASASWHWQEIADRVQGQGVRTSTVLHSLSIAAGASADHRQQLELVIDWLAWLGLVQRADDKVIAVIEKQDNHHEPDASAPVPVDADATAADVDEVAGAPAEEISPATAKAPQLPVDDGALVSMNFSVRITADDAAKLSDDQMRTLLEFAEKMRGK